MVIPEPGLTHRILIMDPYLFSIISDYIIDNLFQCFDDTILRLEFLIWTWCEFLQSSLQVYDIKVLNCSQDELFCSLGVDVHGVVAGNPG